MSCPVSVSTPTRSGFRIYSLIPILILGLLLSFPSLSIRGALNGLLLWFHVVLPTLAPFLICTQMITALGGIELIMRPFGPLLQNLFHLSLSGSYILLCGLLCGYPLGAKLCADFRKRGVIQEKEAAYLLAICNHPSPMFLSGYVQAQLALTISPALLFFCLYLPILPLSWIARRIYRIDKNSGNIDSTGANATIATENPLLEDVIASACETMVIIGGYIMLFSILVVWIQEFPYGSSALRAFLTGAAEITTGVNSLCTFFHDKKALMPVICAVAFGGFSGIFQTKSVIKGTGLSIRQYMGWKLAHAFLSLFLTACLLSLPVR